MRQGIVLRGLGLAQLVMSASLAAELAGGACVLHLRLDESSGARCQDRSAHGNDAVIVAGKRVHDASGGALLTGKAGDVSHERRGSGRAAVIKPSPSLAFGSELTISAWVKLEVEPKDMAGPWPSIVYKFAPGVYGFRLGFIRSANTAFLKWGDGSNKHGYGLKSRKKSWARGWHHFVGVISSTPTLYVDGTLDNRAAMRGGFEDREADVVLGCDGFRGTIDEVRLFNRALTAAEAQALYTSMLPIAGGRNVRVAPEVAHDETPRPARPANLIPGDSGFESGIDHHWDIRSATRERTSAARGCACAKLVSCPDGAGFDTSDITVDPSRTYTFSAFLKGKGRAVLRIVTVHPDDPYNGNWSKSKSFRLTDSWERRHVTLEPGWNWTGKWSRVGRSGHKFRACIAVGSQTECYVDSLQFEAADAPTDYVPSQRAGITIATGKPGNVLLVGEPRVLTFDLYAHGRQDAVLRCRVTACDSEVVCSLDERVELDANHTARHLLRLPGDRKGFFTVKAQLVAAGRILANTDFTFCIVEGPRAVPAQAAFFGLQGRLTEEWAEAMRRIGVKWFRLSTPWTWIERKKGVLNWDKRDRQIALLESKGISIMGLISGTPPWAVVPAPPDDYRKWGYPPRDMNELERFMEKLTARYRGRVDIWEFWNEPYGGFFAIPPDWKRTKGQVFAEMLKAAYRGAKKGNRDCKVCINPTGCDMIAKGRNDFLNDVLANAPDAFDVFNHHPYTSPVSFGVVKVRSPEKFKMVELMDMTRELLKTKARGQEIWNSEQGYTLDFDAPADGEHAVSYAKHTVRSLLLQRAAPIRRVFWFMNYDSRLSNNRKGMWRNGKQPLPVVASYAAAAQALEGAGCVRKLALSSDVTGLYAYAFEVGAGSVAAVWLAEPCAAEPVFQFAEPGSTEVVDIMGNALASVSRDAGKIAFPISDSPVYVLARATSWERLAAAVERGRVFAPALSLAAQMTRSRCAEVVVSNTTDREVSGVVLIRTNHDQDRDAREKSLKFRLGPREQHGFEVSIEEALSRGRVSVEAVADADGCGFPVRCKREFGLLACPRARGLAVDGSMSDWPSAVSAGRFAALCDDSHLYLACRVEQALAAALESASRMRLGDCLRLRFRVSGDTADQELLVGLSCAGPQAYRASASLAFEVGILPHAQVAVVGDGAGTVYEIALPLRDVLPAGTDLDAAVELSVSAVTAGRECRLGEPVSLIRGR